MPSPSDSTATHPPRRASISSSEDLSRLRKILLAPEQNQLEQLQERLDNLAFYAKDVSRVLPDAILLRSKQDAKLVQSLAPLIEESLTLSIKKSPRMIVDAISPIMGPAIRTAILNALRGMVQSLNQTLEYSVSWKGLQWRLEAFRTGKSFAEVVLLHTLRFRVEQVFLIDRQTGLLLQHVAADFVAVQDESVVSGMLTAIQDFVRDSFGGRQSDSLESMRVGELTVWLEQGPKAILAGVIRGTPPNELRDVFREVLETLHVQFNDTFDSLDNNPESFEEARPHLDDCLQAQFEKKTSSSSPVFWAILVLLIGGLVAWGFLEYRDHQRWKTFLTHTEQEPGITVTSVDHQRNTVMVNGLRDPLAADPTEIAIKAGLDVESITFDFEPYFAVSPHFIKKRAMAQLQPPASVEMALEDATLQVSGQASHKWIREFREVVRTIPGVSHVAAKRLIDTDVTRFETLRKRIEGQHIVFASGEALVSDSGKLALSQLSGDIKKLDESAGKLGQEVWIEIRGETSQEGSVERNKQLRLERAYAVWKALPRLELPNTYILPVAGEGRRLGKPSTDHLAFRRVSFTVIHKKKIQGEGIFR